MKAFFQLSKHAPEVTEGDVSNGVHKVDGGDGVEVGVLQVIAFGARLFRGMVVGALVFFFFLSGRAVTGVGGRRGLVGYR